MLLEGHDLQGVVPEVADARQHVLTELVERGDLLILGAHADMGLVDEGAAVVRDKAGMPPAVFLRRKPYLGGENLRFRILDAAGRIGRKPLAAAAVPLHQPFEQRAVRHLRSRQTEFPVAASDGVQPVSLILPPAVEIPDEVYRRGIRSPLPEDHFLLVGVHSVVQVVVHCIREPAAISGQLLFPDYQFPVAFFNLAPVGHQIWILVEYHSCYF